MQKRSFSYVKQHLLLLGWVVCAVSSANDSVSVDPKWAAADLAYKNHCAASLVMRAKVNATDGIEHIAALRTLNDELEAKLEKGELTAAELFDRGIVAYSPEVLLNKQNQTIPFRKLLTPKSFKGLLIPTKKGKDINPQLFDGTFLAYAGIGFDVSTEMSLLEIAGTFINGSNPSLAITPFGKKLKMIGIPAAAPMNGMGSDAPFGIGSAEGMVEVLRHDVIIVTVLFGKKPFVIGRSQGGLNAKLAASRVRGIRGAIGLNSSNPIPSIVQGTIDSHEEMAKPENVAHANACGFSCNFHELSWEAHRVHTSSYEIPVMHEPSQAPVLHLVGSKDWAYPAEWLPSWQAWTAQQPDKRQIKIFNGPHNMWMRPGGANAGVFDLNVAAMREFFVEHLNK